MGEASGVVDLRETRSEDCGFLFELYCDVRGPEVAAWGWPASQRDWFLRMQFDAQRSGYEATYPGANHRIILCDGAAIGRCMTVRAADGLHLVDIALLASHRNRGIGTGLIRELMKACAEDGTSLHLQVTSGNPAQRLYERLGFEAAGTDGVYLRMKWTATSQS